MISKGFYFSSKIEKNKGDRDFNTRNEKNRNLHHSLQVRENDINALTPQNEKTFYFKH